MFIRVLGAGEKHQKMSPWQVTLQEELTLQDEQEVARPGRRRLPQTEGTAWGAGCRGPGSPSKAPRGVWRKAQKQACLCGRMPLALGWAVSLQRLGGSHACWAGPP